MLMGFLLQVTCGFSLETFNTLSLLYILGVLTIICCGDFLFGLILSSNFLICMSVSFCLCGGEFSPMTLLEIWSSPLAQGYSPLCMSIIQRFVLFVYCFVVWFYCHISYVFLSWVLCFVSSFNFSCYFLFGLDPLFYLQDSISLLDSLTFKAFL